jgi:formylglycine-generating enzyme required for sulfatase activity
VARPWLVSVLLLGCYASHGRSDGEPDAGHAREPDAGRAIDASRVDAGPACVTEATMVTVEGSSGRYRIDVTEVTEREYARFLRCAPDAPAPAGCGAVTDHRPCAEVGFDPGSAGDLPVRCVSWCSASAYCASVGRRLCTLEEWMPACESTRDRAAPGDLSGWEPLCVLSAYSDGEWGSGPLDVPVPVATASRCRGRHPPFDAVYDAIGNVEELVGDCESGTCLTLGNSYSSGRSQPCAIEPFFARDDQHPTVGFRCCAD